MLIPSGDDYKKIETIIKKISLDKLIALQRELQFAAKSHYARVEHVSRVFKENNNGSPRKRARDESHHSLMSDKIIQSIIYSLVRRELSFHLDIKLTKNWVGWINLDSEKIRELNIAIGVIAAYSFQKANLLNSQVSEKELEKAKTIIAKYELNGIFFECDDLNKKFLEHYKI